MRSSLPKLTLLFYILVLGLLSLAPAQSAIAQSVTDGTTPGALTPGAPAGSYSLSGFDNVSLFNGNLNFSLPLAAVSGRGGMRIPISLLLERHWRVDRSISGDPNALQEIDYPIYTDWVERPKLEAGRLEVRTQGDNLSPCPPDGQTYWDPAYYTETLSRITWTSFDGTEYELIDQLTGGQLAANGQCIPVGNNYRFRGTVFKSTDGSEVTFIADSQIVDDAWPGNSPTTTSGYLLFKDGTRYRIDNGGVSWIRDRNGNKTLFGYGNNVMTITDSLNRLVTIEYNVNDVSPYGLCDRITMTGFGGAPRVIRISRTALSNVLRTTQSGDSATPETYYQLFPSLNGSSSSTPFNPSAVVSAVWLPNNESYQFRYNVYGELARVDLPTGGAMEYDWGAGEAGDDVNGGVHIYSSYEVYRRVLTRRIYKAASTLEGSTTYSRSVLDQAVSSSDIAKTHVDVASKDPSGAVLAKSRHYFYGSSGDTLSQSGGIRLYYPNTWKGGKEFKTEALTTDGADTVLRRVENTFQQRAHISWWQSYMGAQEFEPASDPRPIETRTTLVDSNQVTTNTFSYDQYNNQTDANEYDYGSGVPGALVRHTHTDYVTASSYTGTGVYLLSLPVQTSVDAGGATRALTTIEYDNYSTEANHAGLVSRSSISGFDAAFTTSYTTRGNPTATTRYLLNSSGGVTGSISGYAQYDIAGNVVSAIDGKGNATTFDFTDHFGAPDGDARANAGSAELNSASQHSYAFPTSITGGGLTIYTQFDYYLGRPVDFEDANGVVSSSYSDNEPLDRPTRVIRAANLSTDKSQTLFAYDDTNHLITTTSDQASFNDPTPLKSQIVYDGLGRTTETRQYEGGTNYSATQQQYDALGRAYRVSNPYRPWQQSESPLLWTTSAFDALGRVTSITTPDTAHVTSSYSGNTVTVTDQMLNARKSVTDALGRLSKVYEDPSGVNYLTSYDYDALDGVFVKCCVRANIQAAIL